MERKDNLKDLYIGIGSNIGNPIENINVALNFLSKSDFFITKGYLDYMKAHLWALAIKITI